MALGQRLFTYGSLMRGERYHKFLEGQQYVGPARTRGRLYSMMLWPAARFDEDGVVHGEVYLISKDRLRTLDQMEQEGYLYDRILVKLEDGTKAWAYQCARYFEDLPVVVNGDWKNPDPPDVKHVRLHQEED